MLQSVFRSRFLLSRAVRRFSSYPPHEVVAMPALSPTMQSGTIGKWLIKDGSSVSAGETIAEIQTDKATMAYDAVDDMIVAKILVPDGAEVAVGSPIMVTVEDESVVSKFADFKVEAQSTTPVAPKEELKKEHKEAPKEAPKEVPKEVPKTQNAVKEAPKPKADKPKEQPKPAPSTKHPWGLHIKDHAMASIIAAEQKAYIEKYGGEAHVTVSSSK